MASQEDQKYIATVLIPELLNAFNNWSREYKQDRDLGIRGEFVGLYRKARKLKTLLWDRRDGDPPPEMTGWREGPRQIMLEVVAHGLLMLVDWDREHPPPDALKIDSDDKHPTTPDLSRYILNTCGYIWDSFQTQQQCILEPHDVGTLHRSATGEVHFAGHGG